MNNAPDYPVMTKVWFVDYAFLRVYPEKVDHHNVAMRGCEACTDNDTGLQLVRYCFDSWDRARNDLLECWKQYASSYRQDVERDCSHVQEYEDTCINIGKIMMMTNPEEEKI